MAATRAPPWGDELDLGRSGSEQESAGQSRGSRGAASLRPRQRHRRFVPGRSGRRSRAEAGAESRQEEEEEEEGAGAACGVRSPAAAARPRGAAAGGALWSRPEALVPPRVPEGAARRDGRAGNGRKHREKNEIQSKSRTEGSLRRPASLKELHRDTGEEPGGERAAPQGSGMRALPFRPEIWRTKFPAAPASLQLSTAPASSLLSRFLFSSLSLVSLPARRKDIPPGTPCLLLLSRGAQLVLLEPPARAAGPVLRPLSAGAEGMNCGHRWVALAPAGCPVPPKPLCSLQVPYSPAGSPAPQNSAGCSFTNVRSGSGCS
ncbi:uncharacterized protein LOC125334567 [Corvus hawaiiensis]|uniref:uncharacterized protein LOC125334567 n=1 Tax=Corvus hawaiiensis TaxID=134902 RepID=UPI0020184802|nr:uncharacterized protein LOC125334567 [Corvus hawaiiensis]